MASQFSIPRFLLPQSSGLWRRVATPTRLQPGDLLVHVRRASSRSDSKSSSSSAKAKPLTLAKPERFVPPSHGSRLPSGKPRPQQMHYGGDLSAEQVAAQRRNDYPGLPPPPQSWAHWFLHSTTIHLCITTGTLASLALYTAIENFKATSPFVEMLPSGDDFMQHPFMSLRTCYEVWRLNTLHTSAMVNEKHSQFGDDLAKRAVYRKAHGIEQGGFGSWTMKDPNETPAEEATKREKLWGIF